MIKRCFLFATAVLLSCSANAMDVKVGFATRDITPKHVVSLGGYGVYFGTAPHHTRQNTHGVHDPLHATATALKGLRSFRRG